MALRDEIPLLLKYIKSHEGTIDHNKQLFDIYEGYLADYVLLDLQKQMSAQSFDQIKLRLSPINILVRVVQKLSRIYSKSPLRELIIESPKDQEIMGFYKDSFELDTFMGMSNEFFNLFKNTLIEPYIGKYGKPKLRVYPSDRFLVFSNDRVDPTCPTHVVKFMGKQSFVSPDSTEKNPLVEDLNVYYLYTDTEFLPINERGKVLQDVLNELNNPEGVNVYGVLPFVYINKSRHSIIPLIDTDTLRMTKIFPILLSDLNFSVLYQTFSIIYGIDVDNENLTMSPNAFWNFKSDPSSNKTPSIGSIKPQVDIAEVMNFIASQLSFWLQSKNIRPGSVGDLTAENMSSGVAKIVDEMDTYDERQRQVSYFQDGEEKLWNLVINHLHPYWVANHEIDETRLFENGQEVDVTFPDQKPMVSKQQILSDAKLELELGITTRKVVIMQVNPELSEEQADEFLEIISEENTVTVEETPTTKPNNNEQMNAMNGKAPAKSDQSNENVAEYDA